MTYLILSIRFLLELALLVAVGVGAYHVGGSSFIKYGFAILAPLLVACVWWIFISPKALIIIPFGAKLLIELLLFILGASLLYIAGYQNYAILLITLALLNRGMMYMWKVDG
ncbi:DUF2568 domain-containing protein [Alkalihalobacillus pseudalcaliphilus]|uniref:DUF2568 domain-containing protein n=1 Tax=Alkalihalobacillus pseudalcaliphilus TaxID=79884 RepID=UPI00064DBEB9|nr:DUF2568 domain-containing protein [Alkalihalobacillus pseudalcaliphilus]KMK77723.1 hypothetical protein AB990_04515 [Alkalihalobacillus pseudalcaliphilus]